ncbi:calcineurin-like phosphoesterase family protein [Dysgonomonas alginatilytica]|uniref:Calcineurin-like phosphoesterase family protein n=1 Tax=Dysgonomonas alginatilytica TaxID=1605892 RepID=A0A2V3PJZ8_9BACT|nr:metallophosphoesterase [Dysgonomonas alginatilytica]PXV61229.1 calcineurin-like phosphoesterase family protein [Dysgonomonas alginatilytica]
MKICVISDIHGSTLWETIVDREYDNVDRFIFLGDYLDAKYEQSSPSQQVENLEHIVEFKEEFQSVDLLIGNHDLQYVGGEKVDFNSKTYELVKPYLTFLIERGMLQVITQYDNYLFSHAGLSSVWMKKKGINSESEINQRFKENPLFVDYVSKSNSDNSGDNDYQSPLWIRPASLGDSAYGNNIQVIGHNRLESGQIEIVHDKNRKFILTDTGMKQYLIIDTESGKEEILNI